MFLTISLQKLSRYHFYLQSNYIPPPFAHILSVAVILPPVISNLMVFREPCLYIKYQKIRKIRFCSYAKEYGSKKARICVYFTHCCSGVSFADFDHAVTAPDVILTFFGCQLLQNLQKRKKTSEFNRSEMEIFFLKIKTSSLFKPPQI